MLTLNVAPTSETQFIETICEGETYIFNSQALSDAGMYQADLQNSQQCDSTVTLQLLVEDCASCPSEHLVVNGAPVPSGTYTAISSIISQSELALDTIVFLAGDSICLGPGFFGDAGTTFTGEIAPFICDEPGAIIDRPSATIASESRVKPSSSKINSIPTLTVQPNPFYQNTQINFTLDKSEEIVLSIQTLDGQLVQLLQEGKINAGQYHIPYQSKELNGVYIIVLQTTNQVITQKMISLK